MHDWNTFNWMALIGAAFTVVFLYSSVGHDGATGHVTVTALQGLGSRALVWQPVFVGAVVVVAACARLGAYLGVNRWRTTTFRRALASVLWIAAGKLILTGK